MNTQLDSEKVSLTLPVFCMDKPAISANLIEISGLIELLVRTHAVVSLLYYTTDPKLKHIRDNVRSNGFLTNEMVKGASSSYPLEFVSLKAESPLVLNLRLVS